MPNFKIVRVNKEGIKKAILALNLSTEEGGYSGSVFSIQSCSAAEGLVLLMDNKLAGWLVYFPKSNASHVYVRKDLRRQGLGTRLIRNIEKKYTPRVIPWDSRSEGFFKSVGISEERWY